MRGSPGRVERIPDFAALHPGYRLHFVFLAHLPIGR